VGDIITLFNISTDCPDDIMKTVAGEKRNTKEICSILPYIVS
jgi:hypothetical protein